jgi:hypothetical protein
MNNIDFDINNYTFNDILKLFKLPEDYSETHLTMAKDIVIQMHPDNSQLEQKYYKLFSQAYKILDTHFGKKGPNVSSYDPNNIYNEILNVAENNTILEKEKPLVVNSINSCYNPSIYSTQLVSIHTEDRDIKKYPLQSYFEVELPQVFKNVLSLELYDITLPTYYYNISTILQNTSLWFSIPFFFTDPIQCVLESGYYNDVDFPALFAKCLNDATTAKLNTIYTDFDVSLGKVSNKLTIYNKSHDFQFWCQKKIDYIDCVNDNWNMLIDWGLPYNLGFDKLLYDSIYDASQNLFILAAPNLLTLSIDNTIYMEMDKFNYINEIHPFSISTTDYYKNDYNGIVNSAFAKLIISDVTNKFVPVAKFERILPHIEEKIGRLKFRFRYHNGNLVDFLKQDFNFSIKMNCRFDCKY